MSSGSEAGSFSDRGSGEGVVLGLTPTMIGNGSDGLWMYTSRAILDELDVICSFYARVNESRGRVAHEGVSRRRIWVCLLLARRRRGEVKWRSKREIVTK